MASIGDIWSAVTMLSFMIQKYPNEANELSERAERTIPNFRYYMDHVAADPIYNYMPFDCPEGALPNGDIKSSPLKFHLDTSKQRIVVTGNRCGYPKGSKGTQKIPNRHPNDTKMLPNRAGGSLRNYNSKSIKNL